MLLVCTYIPLLLCFPMHLLITAALPLVTATKEPAKGAATTTAAVVAFDVKLDLSILHKQPHAAPPLYLVLWRAGEPREVWGRRRGSERQVTYRHIMSRVNRQAKTKKRKKEPDWQR